MYFTTRSSFTDNFLQSIDEDSNDFDTYVYTFHFRCKSRHITASNLASTNPYIRWCDSKGPKAGGNVHRCASTKLQLPVKQRRHLRDWIRADRMPDLVLRLMPDGDPNIFPNPISTLPVYQLFRRSYDFWNISMSRRKLFANFYYYESLYSQYIHERKIVYVCVCTCALIYRDIIRNYNIPIHLSEGQPVSKVAVSAT